MKKIIVARKGGGGEYIGRGSPLGNPFSSLDKSMAEVQVINREVSIAEFSAYLVALLGRGEPGQAGKVLLERLGAKARERRSGAVKAEMNRLLGLAMEHDELRLECYCAPLPCHGHFIARLLAAELQAKGEKVQVI